MSDYSKLPPYEKSLAAVVLGAKEAVIAPMRPRLREYNITEPQWRVMRVINDRGLTDATGLAEMGLLHAPSVTRILKELEERKLVMRESDPRDRRRSLIALSATGHQIVEVISHQVARIVHAYSERFGAERLEALTNELRALSAAIKDVE